MPGGPWGAATILGFIFFVVLSASVSAIELSMHHRQAQLLESGLEAGRSYVVSQISNTITEGSATPDGPFPNAIETSLPACPGTSSGYLCQDTMTITATLRGSAAPGAAGTTVSVAPNVNVASSPGGTPVSNLVLYQLNVTLNNPSGSSVSSRKGLFTVGTLDVTAASDAAIDDGFYDYAGATLIAARQSEMGTCAQGTTLCSTSALGVQQTAPADTRIHAQTLCSDPRASATVGSRCTPVGIATATPEPIDQFANQNVNGTVAGWQP